LIGEPQEKTPSTVMQALKPGLARRLLAQARRQRNPAHAVLFDCLPQHIWQKSFLCRQILHDAEPFRIEWFPANGLACPAEPIRVPESDRSWRPTIGRRGQV
jgi:hypothetical protein